MKNSLVPAQPNDLSLDFPESELLEFESRAGFDYVLGQPSLSASLRFSRQPIWNRDSSVSISFGRKSWAPPKPFARRQVTALSIAAFLAAAS
jgi:hypothetical protein